MNESTKEINLNVDGRHPDVRIDIQGREHKNINFTVSGSAGRKDPYTGPYEVEAKLEEDQIMETNGKIMTNDMTFKGMEVKVVPNPAGGLTYYIG